MRISPPTSRWRQVLRCPTGPVLKGPSSPVLRGPSGLVLTGASGLAPGGRRTPVPPGLLVAVLLILAHLIEGLLIVSLTSAGCDSRRHAQSPWSGPITLRLYAGAGLRRAVAALAEAFSRATGIGVEPDFGGSGMLISRVRLDPEADLFLPGDVWYVDRLAEETHLVASRKTVACLVPVIIVRRGNPKGVHALEDLLRSDVRVGLGNPRACQIGRLSDEILRRAGGDRTRIGAKESITVEELGVWVKAGDVDAAIVWDVTAKAIADAVVSIEISAGVNVTSTVTVAILTTSRYPGEATRFVDFMTGTEGRAILEREGLTMCAPPGGKDQRGI